MSSRCITTLITAPVLFVTVGLAHGGDRPRLSRFNANGVKIVYFVQGEGEPVVLIHGWLSSAGINWLLPGTSALLAKDHKELKSIRVPMLVLVGGDDDLIKKLYVEPLRRVRKDWQVIEINDANHITCIVKPQFQRELADWIRKNTH